MKPESEWTLEDWAKYHASECKCQTNYKCPGCTIKELDLSWLRTLDAEKDSHRATKTLLSRLRKELDDARPRT